MKFDLKNENGIWLKNEKPYTGDVYGILKITKLPSVRLKMEEERDSDRLEDY